MKLATAALFAVGATAAPFDLDFDFDLSKLRNENSSGLKFGGDRGGKRYFDFKNIFGDREEGSLFSDTGSSGLFTKKEDKLGTVKEVKRTKPDLACPKDFCQNGGECVGKKPNFFCNCPKGFTGTNCQTAVDFCSALSCGDQPIPLECVSLSTGFECRLPETDVTDPNSLFVNGNEVLVFTSDTEADIQMKIDTAAEFDTIIFEAGLYTEIALTIPKSLKIVGAGSGSDPSLDTILDGDFNDGVAFDIAGGDVWIIESIRISEYNTAGVRVQDGLPGEVLVLDNLWVEFNGSHGLQIGFNVIQQQLKKTIVKNSTFLENGSPDTGSSQILFFQYTGAAEIENVEVIGEQSDNGEQAENGIQFRSDLGFFNTISLKDITISGVFEKAGIAFNFSPTAFPGVPGLDMSTLVTENVVVSVEITQFSQSVSIDCASAGPVDVSGIDTTGSTLPLSATACSAAQAPLTFLAGTGPQRFLGPMDTVIGNGETLLVLPFLNGAQTPADAWRLGVEVDKEGEIVSFSSAGATFSVIPLGTPFLSTGCLSLEGITEIIFADLPTNIPIATTSVDIFPTIETL